MTIDNIQSILNAHSVPCFILDGRIYADSMIAFTALFEQVEDLTDYTRSGLYAWLGY